MTAKNHPIGLENLVFTKCIVEAMPGHVPEDGKVSVSPSNHINIDRDDDSGLKWTAMMRTVVNPERDPKWPYYVEMECIAFLTSDGSLDDASAHRGIAITAHSVLFGAIRETVMWLTGRQPYGPLMLGLSVLAPGPLKPQETQPLSTD